MLAGVASILLSLTGLLRKGIARVGVREPLHAAVQEAQHCFECVQELWPASSCMPGLWLTGELPAVASEGPRVALERLIQRSRERTSADALALVGEARNALDPTR